MFSVLCFCTKSASVPPVCHPPQQSRQPVLQGCQDHIPRWQNIWAAAAMCLSDWGKTKRVYCCRDGFRKGASKPPSCSAHKDLTHRMVRKPDRMEYFSYFLCSWKNMKNHRSAFIAIFLFQSLPYLKREEEEEIKLVLPTSLTPPTLPSFPLISWTWLRFLTEKPWVQHRGWEHTEGQSSVCL